MWQIFDLYSLQAFESAVTNHNDFYHSLLVCDYNCLILNNQVESQ